MEKPAILAVSAAYSRFSDQRFSTVESSSPFTNKLVNIVRMNEVFPMPAADIIKCGADVRQPTAVKIVEITVGPPGMNKSGSRIDELAERFVFIACETACHLPEALFHKDLEAELSAELGYFILGDFTTEQCIQIH